MVVRVLEWRDREDRERKRVMEKEWRDREDRVMKKTKMATPRIERVEWRDQKRMRRIGKERRQLGKRVKSTEAG